MRVPLQEGRGQGTSGYPKKRKRVRGPEDVEIKDVLT